MVNDYLITLKKADNRLADLISQLLYFFAIVVFSYLTYQYPESSIAYYIIIPLIIIFWFYTLHKKRKKGEAFFRIGLLVAAAGWLIGPQRNIWMALLYAVAAILEKQVKFPQEIGFTADRILFNTLPKRELEWNAINNVVIKDGLITIDQKNNKLFQKEIEGYVTAELENEFNRFCKNCIAAAGK